MTVQLSEDRYPTLSTVERPFFDHWIQHVVDPEDPHLERWIDYEDGAIERARSRTELVEQFTPVRGRRVLDIGCQNGAWLVALHQAGADPVGIDVVESSIEAAQIRASCWDAAVDARLGDACNLDFPDESFDIIASSDVIEHVPDKTAMVREIMRVMRPGGIAIIVAPQRFSLKHLRTDPHYGYAGVSVFPAPLVEWYLTRFRGEDDYEVETLPTRAGVQRMFRSAGGTILSTDGTPGTADRPLPARAVDELRQCFTLIVTKPST